MNCNICPRACNVNRTTTFGYCGKDECLQIAKVMLHYGEEPFLTKHNGASGAIFFAGCNLKCIYCQNYDISNGSGKPVTVDKLINIFKQLETAGANNIDLVTPTHYAKLIYTALKKYKPSIPVIYNCGGYESEDTIVQLAKVVDIFLFDLKYYDDNLAIKYSAAPNYFRYAGSAIKKAASLKPNKFISKQMVSGVVVRHLCLPSHINDSKQILSWISENLGNSTYVSLMSQYVPMYKAKDYPEINRTLKPIEYKVVVNHAIKLGLKNVFVQDISSSTTEFIPDFNNPGDFKF